MKNNFFKFNKHDFYLGFKKAYNLSLLPPKLEAIHTHLITRVFRVIGGFCIVLVIIGKYLLFIEEIQIIIIIIALSHSIFITLFSIFKFTYGLYLIVFKPEIFEVRD
uniref:hypothetical protein n=1 Tax=Dichomitus squalens TaxID=114155 RepID=UPI0030023780|nr:hypothetical protein [Dichomitus squalens]